MNCMMTRYGCVQHIPRPEHVSLGSSLAVLDNPPCILAAGKSVAIFQSAVTGEASVTDDITLAGIVFASSMSCIITCSGRDLRV